MFCLEHKKRKSSAVYTSLITTGYKVVKSMLMWCNNNNLHTICNKSMKCSRQKTVQWLGIPVCNLCTFPRSLFYCASGSSLKCSSWNQQLPLLARRIIIFFLDFISQKAFHAFSSTHLRFTNGVLALICWTQSHVSYNSSLCILMPNTSETV